MYRCHDEGWWWELQKRGLKVIKKAARICKKHFSIKKIQKKIQLCKKFGQRINCAKFYKV